MAASSSSSGLTFGKKVLEKYGWKEGQGLGRTMEGMAEPLKVARKISNYGLGFNPAAEYTSTWWDHLFRKAADNFEVINDEGDVQITVKESWSQMSDRSVCPPSHVLYSNMDYSSFIKRATLNRNSMQLIEGSSATSESERESSSTSTSALPSDEDLFRACGGRTAHKGARHGLTQAGKLARLERFEREEAEQLRQEARRRTATGIMAGMALHRAWRSDLPPPEHTPFPGAKSLDRDAEEKKKKKKETPQLFTPPSADVTSSMTKKKKKKSKKDLSPKMPDETKSVKVKKVKQYVDMLIETPTEEKIKKKKKKDKTVSRDSMDDDEAVVLHKEKKKKKKKKAAAAHGTEESSPRRTLKKPKQPLEEAMEVQER